MIGALCLALTRLPSLGFLFIDGIALLPYFTKYGARLEAGHVLDTYTQR